MPSNILRLHYLLEAAKESGVQGSDGLDGASGMGTAEPWPMASPCPCGSITPFVVCPDQSLR